ncbi:phosphoribosylformylglycinamidine synthase [Verrucomicrobiaceae bacterium 5K15]|uniref:Phosphoribosylformylglycinamidine synthase n=1 Tax=Oceaniferula flava TaxID=2800421 RepID=A0AAE2VD84_9BACT|nr:phosphoribosylformylglycinamidine synthase [Oceaniferula flavus]MBK1855821.1 phosphoribosylformylglycinamidine synthase [Oceaniferula flavus]MBM1137128.1 phosphoribosylformylglycinamidine synthase [Oceaniferula flavus]
MHRVFVEKQPEFNAPARELLHDLRENLSLDHLENVRVIQRYDVDGLSDDEFEKTTQLILSEPQIAAASDEISVASDETSFAVEFLPGQFDQRADSAAQCVQILTHGERPAVASARVIVLKGALSEQQVAEVKQYVINAVDSREASMEKPESITIQSDTPADVEILEWFTTADEHALAEKRQEMGLAMSLADMVFTQSYFRDEEGRNPSITEIKMLDTYWSDHCRHTTFATKINSVKFQDGTEVVEQAYQRYQETREDVYGEKIDTRPETLMDIALIGMKELRKTGELDNVEISEEINAASIVIPVDVDGEEQEWLLMFKNETHNHPTEIEPFGGAATCLGGCIRDPLSGRSYIFQAMRVTGAADPRTPFADTIPGKLPQRKICKGAADGYSSYGNQIGLATGQVAEVYHPNYVAKRMEIGAVVAAAPKENVFRGTPAAGDVILLIGGRTGRDGVGGATGSSKEHTDTALDNSAEVQKGDAPTERKIQRLFRKAELAKKIKLCNDFGAGGVSVAIGEIAPSLEINLDAVKKKYDGLDGTELAISESQERMAICVDPSEIAYFMEECDQENLECNHVADVTDSGRLIIKWRGKEIVNFSRAFLDTNGVTLDTQIEVAAASSECPLGKSLPSVAAADSLEAKFTTALSDLNSCGQKGLGEQFDASVGAGTVLWPFGGAQQLTPTDAMVAKIPLVDGDTTTASFMAWGFNPNIASWSPYHGALYAVTESVCRIVSAGAHLSDIRLTLQEYFEKLGTDPTRWGKPFAALLGAFTAQNELRLGAIGGKDSMSGSFNDIDVPPTLVSFAVAPGKTTLAVSPEFKATDSDIYLVSTPRDANQLPDFEKLKEIADLLYATNSEGKILAMHSLAEGGIATGISKMSFGNHIGASINSDQDLFQERYFSFLVEVKAGESLPAALNAEKVGQTHSDHCLTVGEESICLDKLIAAWTGTLEPIYPSHIEPAHSEVDTFSYEGDSASRQSSASIQSGARPRVVVPTFPGTNSEYDSAKAFNQAGADAEMLVFRNLTPQAVEESLAALAAKIRESQILMIPGGFSAGDEPDGSGKFIATVLRNPQVSDAIMDLIKNRDGLVLGICNGFQALIKTGLVPYGEIRDPQPGAPTLTFNDIGRHISTYATTRIASTLSPWLANTEVGDLHNVPFSHGEGKFYASDEEIKALAANGQIATQYTDLAGNPSMAIEHNPNGSLYAIEGITSPCGRVLGKMGHTERRGENVAKNIPGNKHQPLFKAGVEYFL